MQVRDGMSQVVLTVGPGHTLREAAAESRELIRLARAKAFFVT